METNQEEGGAQKLQTEEKTKWVIQTAQRERERERERERGRGGKSGEKKVSRASEREIQQQKGKQGDLVKGSAGFSPLVGWGL